MRLPVFTVIIICGIAFPLFSRRPVFSAGIGALPLLDNNAAEGIVIDYVPLNRNIVKNRRLVCSRFQHLEQDSARSLRLIPSLFPQNSRLSIVVTADPGTYAGHVMNV